MNILNHRYPFSLESGAVLPELAIAYHTYGTLNAKKDNVIWICHALTADSNAADWWSGLVGAEKPFDPDQHFIICANMLGSCYGTTGPTFVNPATNKPYAQDFPIITVRDMVRAHQILCQHLEIERIQLIIGGSMGGQQAIEWAIIQPDLFEKVCIIASNAKHSPWGIAFNESQRMAIEADTTLYDGTEEAGRKGLEAARAIAMISYRHYDTYARTQKDEEEKLIDFNASSYQRYQGHKLWKRFDVFSYIRLSQAMDSHDVGRGRGGISKALAQVKAPTLTVGIQSDVLFPINEQRFIAQNVFNAQFEIIDSLYGHDGFLIEYQKLNTLITSFLHYGTRHKPYFEGMTRKVYPGMEQF